MKYHYSLHVLGFAVLALPTLSFSQTVLTGDHAIEPGVGDSGSLTVSGGVLVEGGDIHLGAFANGYAPLVLHYTESGSVRQMVVYTTQSAVEYLWKEGNGNPSLAQSKMSLGADNSLRLYDASGAPAITLSPVSGEISASGGIRLPDNTLLDGSNALRSTALYNALGQKVAEVGEDGVLSVTGGIIFGSNATTQITEDRAAYLNGILEKLGYQEDPITPTPVQAFLGNSTMSGNLSITADSAGNRYIAGSFSGESLNLGRIDIWSLGTAHTQFVAKISPAGSLQWSRRWPVPNNGAITAITVDTSNNVYVTGDYNAAEGQSVNLGGLVVTSRGSSDGYVLKLNSSGVGQWVKLMGSTGADSASSVSVDQSGNVYVAGYYNRAGGQSVDLAGISVTSNGGQDGYVLKLNSAGIGQWAQNMGGTATDSAHSVSVDTAGNVYVAGEYNRAEAHNINLAGLLVTSKGAVDGYVLKLNSSGVGQWAKALGWIGNDSARSVTVDAAGNVYVAGRYTRAAGASLDLAGLPVTTKGGDDGYVLKLNSSGIGQWAKVIGGTGWDSAVSVSVGASGNIYAVGSSSGGIGQNLDIGGISTIAVDTSNGYILKLSESGNSEWAKVIPASISSVYATATGELLISGRSIDTNFMLGGTVFTGSYTSFLAAIPADNAPVERGHNGASELFWGNSVSTGISAVALGDNALAGGDYSVSLGRNSVANSTNATAIGYNANALGNNSFVGGGSDGMAQGLASAVVGGEENRALVARSFIGGGASNYARGEASAIVGGWESMTVGYGSFIAGGMQNHTQGNYSFASGFLSHAQANRSFVIGSANVPQGSPTSWISTDDLFVIGNGDPDAWGDDRRNAFVVHKNGNARGGGTFEARGGVRVPPSGDIPMGTFTAGSNPASLNAGLRYSGE